MINASLGANKSLSKVSLSDSCNSRVSVTPIFILSTNKSLVINQYCIYKYSKMMLGNEYLICIVVLNMFIKTIIGVLIASMINWLVIIG